MLHRPTSHVPRSDDHYGFRWWDYGVLTALSGALLLFCSVLAVRQYDQTDARRLAAAAASPQSLPTPICTVGKVTLAQSSGRTLCYDVHD
jgi:hypothetical protein